MFVGIFFYTAKLWTVSTEPTLDFHLRVPLVQNLLLASPALSPHSSYAHTSKHVGF